MSAVDDNAIVRVLQYRGACLISKETALAYLRKLDPILDRILTEQEVVGPRGDNSLPGEFDSSTFNDLLGDDEPEVWVEVST